MLSPRSKLKRNRSVSDKPGSGRTDVGSPRKVKFGSPDQQAEAPDSSSSSPSNHSIPSSMLGALPPQHKHLRGNKPESLAAEKVALAAGVYSSSGAASALKSHPAPNDEACRPEGVCMYVHLILQEVTPSQMNAEH